jgi:mono/diheme cytochrome c family protein
MRIRSQGCVLAALCVILPAYSQAQGTTVLDKVYTEAQAARGAGEFQSRCTTCHEGDEADAPPLKGPAFIDRWREAPLDFLFAHIRTDMPGNAPGSLSEAAYLDVVAYLLQANSYPAGNTELKTDKLGGILLVGPNGPQPLPANALVRVVGCLAGAGDDWSLTSASDPMRVRVSDETTPEELAQSAATPLGAAVYRLRNASDLHADTLKGKRVQAKGVFNLSGNTSTVSLQSLERVGAGCDK